MESEKVSYIVEEPGVLVITVNDKPVLPVDIVYVERAKENGYGGCYVCGVFVNFLGKTEGGSLYRVLRVSDRKEYYVIVRDEDEAKAKELLKKSLEIKDTEFEVFVRAFFEHVEKSGSLIVEPLDFDFNVPHSLRVSLFKEGEYILLSRRTMKEHLAIEKINSYLEKTGYRIVVYSDSPGNYTYIIIPTRIREEALVDLAISLDEEPNTITKLAILNYAHEYNDNSPEPILFKKLVKSMQQSVLNAVRRKNTVNEEEKRLLVV